MPRMKLRRAPRREQVNQKADEWWAKAKGLRFVHPIRSYPSKRWAIVCASVLASSSSGCPRWAPTCSTTCNSSKSVPGSTSRSSTPMAAAPSCGLMSAPPIGHLDGESVSGVPRDCSACQPHDRDRGHPRLSQFRKFGALPRRRGGTVTIHPRPNCRALGGRCRCALGGLPPAARA